MPRSLDELRAAIDADPDRRARSDELTIALLTAATDYHDRTRDLANSLRRANALGDALAALIQDAESFGRTMHQRYHLDEPWQACSREACGGLRRALTRAREALGEAG